MIRYEIEPGDIEAQLDKFRQFPRIADKRMTAAMHKSTIVVRTNVRSGIKSFTGEISSSIGSRVKHIADFEVEGIVESSLKGKQFPVIATYEGGRAAGRKMPPLQDIDTWAQSIGAAASEVFAVARAIARKGVKGRFPFKKGWGKSRNLVTKLFTHALEHIAEDIAIDGH